MSPPRKILRDDLFRKAWLSNLKVEQIAIALGVSTTAVCAAAKEMGLPRRRRGQRTKDGKTRFAHD